MKPFVGSWKCDTKFAAGAFGPGSPEVNAKSTVAFKKDMNGFFYRGDYEVKKQKGVEKQETYYCRAGNPDAKGANVPDPHYTIRAWRAVVTYLLRRQEFLYE